MPGVKLKVKPSPADTADIADEFVAVALPAATAAPRAYRRSPASSSPSTNRTVK